MIAPLARRFPSLGQNTWLFAKGWSLWAPFLGAGIKIDRISDDFREVDVSLRLSLRNMNYVGTHFGGSLYAMTDPFYMIMFMKNLGREYIVWDKSAKIDFLKPGKGRICAEFRLNDNDIEQVKAAIESSGNGKHLWHRTVEVKNTAGEIIARVEKTLYFRKKN